MTALARVGLMLSAITMFIEEPASAGVGTLSGPCLGGVAAEAAAGPRFAVAGDVDHDGDADLVTGNFFGTSHVDLLRARDDGTFDAAQTIADFGAAIPEVFVKTLALEDLDADGHLDLVALPLGVLPGDGHGGFGALLPFDGFASVDSIFRIRLGDVNSDGRLDAVLIGQAQAAGSPVLVVTYLGAGDGTFAALPAQPVLTPLASTEWHLGDMDDDGTPDLVGGISIGLQQFLALSRGHDDGTFEQATSFPRVPPVDSETLLLDDFNADGHTDVVTVSGSRGLIELWLGDGAAQLSKAGEAGVPGQALPVAGTIASGDFDGDGDMDVALAHFSSGSVFLFAGDGEGRLAMTSEVLPQTLAKGLQRADLDGDGRDDLLVADYYGDLVHALHGSPTAFVAIGFALGDATLSGAGSTSANEQATLQVGGVPPGAAGLLFVSSGQFLAQFQGGVLVPLPEVVWPIGPGAALSMRWPGDTPAGLQLYAQAWLTLPGGGVTATNALAMVAR